MNFDSKFINKLHISLNPFMFSFMNIFQLNALVNWTNSSTDLKLLFQTMLNIQSVPLTISIVDDSLIGLGAILFQSNTDNQMQSSLPVNET